MNKDETTLFNQLTQTIAFTETRVRVIVKALDDDNPAKAKILAETLLHKLNNTFEKITADKVPTD